MKSISLDISKAQQFLPAGAVMAYESKVAEAQKALAGTNKSLKSIQKQTVGIVARGAVKQIKAVIKATTLTE